MKRVLLLLTALAISSASLANETQFTAGQSPTIQPNLAYILVRSFNIDGGGLHGTSKFSPILIRLLSKPEIDDATALVKANPQDWTDKVEPNVVEPLADKPYYEKGNEEYLLMAMKPGVYVMGGVAVTNWASVSEGVIVTGLSMGTVQFDAKPGVITDLGAVLVAFDDEPTSIPELSKVVSGKDRGFGPEPPSVALRLPAPAEDLPGGLDASTIVSADYRASAPFLNFLGARVSRLAPIPGIFDYDKNGHVIDLRSLALPAN